MREISVYELEYMASRELCELARKIDGEMPLWPESSPERRNGCKIACNNDPLRGCFRVQ